MRFRYFHFYSFDNDDMKSSKRHVILLSLIFLLKCFSKSFLIKVRINGRIHGRSLIRHLSFAFYLAILFSFSSLTAVCGF